MTSTWSLVLHGGAGAIADRLYEREEAHMAELLQRGAAMLTRGESALDVVTTMAEELEACGLHVAGKGAAPNSAGAYELDAAIMHGPTRRAGAVAALQGFLSPIRVARAVMEETPHVLLAGEGAARFASARGFERVSATYYAPAQSGLPEGGTIGAVARDTTGRLAAATSTGGTRGKLPGRVGDSPLIAAGCWADDRAAVSCTGVGEYFIRAAAAHDIAARMRYAGASLADAAAAALAQVETLGGEGGLIAVDADGNVTAPFNTHGMKRGFVTSTGAREVKTFR